MNSRTLRLATAMVEASVIMLRFGRRKKLPPRGRGGSRKNECRRHGASRSTGSGPGSARPGGLFSRKTHPNIHLYSHLASLDHLLYYESPAPSWTLHCPPPGPNPFPAGGWESSCAGSAAANNCIVAISPHFGSGKNREVWHFTGGKAEGATLGRPVLGSSRRVVQLLPLKTGLHL